MPIVHLYVNISIYYYIIHIIYYFICGYQRWFLKKLPKHFLLGLISKPIYEHSMDLIRILGENPESRFKDIDPEYDLQYNTYIGHQWGPLSKDLIPRSAPIYVKVPFVYLKVPEKLK